jgi:hypothetical protein
VVQLGTGDVRYEAILTTIQARVCKVCMDQKDDGTCGLRKRVCAIETHLPGVVQVVAGIDSDRMDDYVAALESQVCGGCAQQDAAGSCSLRQEGECALHSYLSLVVDAIQDLRRAEGRAPLLLAGAAPVSGG